MTHQYLSRSEVKAQAKAQLHEPGVFKNMVLANLIPWLIQVVFYFLMMGLLIGMYKSMLANNGSGADAQTAILHISQSRSAEVQKQSLIQALISLWFTQGVAITALDVYRGKLQQFNPLKAVFRLFNSRYFFGVLLLAIVSRLLIQLGSYIIVPGILLAYGWSQIYFVFYDGRERGPFGVFQALGVSWRLMRGFKLDLFVFQLSLLGWYILEGITFNLFNLLIDPYLQVAKAGFYENVRQYQADLQTQQ